MARISLEIVPKCGENKVIHSAITRRGLRMPGPEVNWKDWAEENPPFDEIAGDLENFKYEDIKIFLGLDVEDLVWPVEEEGSRLFSEDGRFKAFRTRLGWTISGPAVVDEQVSTMCCYMATVDEPADEPVSDRGLISAFHDFNELESIGILVNTDPFSPAERREQTRMEKTATQLPDGRWEVPMLTKSTSYFPPTERQARVRLQSLHRKLAKNSVLREKYLESIDKDLKSGYIEKCSSEKALEIRQGSHCFLPHFPVFHPDKPDKLRRVCDASVELNKHLHIGPRNLNPMLGVIFRFRLGKYAINADIKEHFSQVAIPKHQQPLVAFLWHENPESEPDVYVNTRHIFGAACSPAVAIFALSKAAECDPKIKPVVENSFYMDDFYYSNNSRRSLQDTALRVQQALQTGGFDLSKWMSNHKDSLRHWPLEQRAKELKPLGEDLEGHLPLTKALGLAWDCEVDKFTFQSRKLAPEFTTVASVLSALASVFDPIGIIAPYVLTGKQLFQELWYETKDWKKPVPEDVKKQMTSWCDGLETISQLGVPRWFGFPSNEELTLHSFADASKKGYGTANYLAASAASELPTAFVIARTRVVPPPKRDNIPRLELQAGLTARLFYTG